MQLHLLPQTLLTTTVMQSGNTGFDWRGWADEAGTRAKEPFYGFTEFFRDLDADLKKRQQRRGSQPKTLYEEFADLGEEFVEWLEGATGSQPHTRYASAVLTLHRCRLPPRC